MTSQKKLYHTTALGFPEFPETSQPSDYDESTHSWHLGPASTTPRSLCDFTEKHGHRMPEGVYLFFGNTARYHIEAEINYLDKLDPPGVGYDIKCELSFEKADTSSSPRTLVWRDPSIIKSVYIGAGMTDKRSADALRYITGDKYCFDRLAAEPWRIDDYIGALEVLHGPIRAVVFSAMLNTGEVAPMIRVLDPSLITEVGPLGVYTSLMDPDPPTIRFPSADWSGWKAHPMVMPEEFDGMVSFVDTPLKKVDLRKKMLTTRTAALVEQGRLEQNEIADRLIQERLSNS